SQKQCKLGQLLDGVFSAYTEKRRSFFKKAF
ncbi:uncharacterized protein METZ01_LOCUS515572, partial [marine metagenome]